MEFLVEKSYCTSAQVAQSMGFAADTTNVTTAMVTQSIKWASDEVDLLSNTRYWSVEDNGTAESGTTTSLTDTDKEWTVDGYTNYVVWIYGGTGSGQYSRITSNTATALTLTDTLTTAPSSDSTYRIIPDVYISESLDGDGTTSLYLQKYPFKAIVSLVIDGTTVSTSKVYTYQNEGLIKLHGELSPEMTTFVSTPPQANVIKYLFGVYPIPTYISRLTANIAAMQCIITQIGGTYDDVTSYSLPGGFTASLGEPYVNIRETLIRLGNENKELVKRIRKVPVVV